MFHRWTRRDFLGPFAAVLGLAWAAPLARAMARGPVPQDLDVARIPAAERAAAFNRLMEAVPGQNAADHYRQADAAFVELFELAQKADSKLLKQACSDAEVNLHDLVCKQKWSSSESLAMRSWLKANEGVLRHLKAASDCPRFQWIISGDVGRFSQVVVDQLPHSMLRRSLKLMTAAAAEAAMRGAWDEAYAWNRRALQVSRHASQTPLEIAQLVAIASEEWAGRQLSHFLRRHAPTDWDALTIVLQSGVQAKDQSGRIATGERLFNRDHIEACYAWAADPSSEPSIDQSIRFVFADHRDLDAIAAATGEPLFTSSFKSLDEFRSALGKSSVDKDWAVQIHVDALFDQWRARPFHEAWRDADRFQDQMCRTQAAAPSLMLYGCGPSSIRGHMMQQVAAMRRQALLACVALHKFRQQHGRWPGGIDELIPMGLASPPLDVFSGWPLVYRLNPDGADFILYSIGADLKDDQGRPSPTRKDPGDLVFWPPPAPDVPEP